MNQQKYINEKVIRMANFRVFIGGSAGSIAPITTILSSLPADFNLIITIVIHSSGINKSSIPDAITSCCPLTAIEISDKEVVKPNTIYVAPGGYHLYVENKNSYSLSVDKKEHYSRPSIDVLFTSAAEAFGKNCIAILLSGANEDGAEGLLNVKRHGGLTIVQSPESSQVSIMPHSAIENGAAIKVLSPSQISRLLLEYSDLN
jgi:two-component system chemotaxis response regulator CheB